MNKKPVLCVTLGDACGIGPELVAKGLQNKDIFSGIKFLIIGSKAVFDQGCRTAGISSDISDAGSAQDALEMKEDIVLVNIDRFDLSHLTVSEVNTDAGKAVLEVGNYCLDLYRKGILDGMVFAPVNKESMKMGGSRFEGYKAYLADALGVKATSAEINSLGDLWTTRVTSHIAISEVPAQIKKDRILSVLRYFDREMKRFGMENTKIAVTGLNPHNGDGGLAGREEIDEIAPAVAAAQAEGIQATGPYPSDTVFLTAEKQNIPGVLAMYHDQCQIATKLMGFDRGVTYFGGLPFRLCTPAHGTAFDIAGKGEANPQPFLNAVEMAKRMILSDIAVNV